MRGGVLGTGLGLVLIGVVLLGLVRLDPPSSLVALSKIQDVSSHGGLSISAWNSESRHSQKQPGPGYAFLREYGLIEPFAETSFTVEGYSLESAASLAVLWTLTSVSSGAREFHSTDWLGVNSSFAGAVGRYHISASISSSSSPTSSAAVTSAVSGFFESRYVRRSIRSMSPRARDSFFDAFAVLDKLSLNEGRALYGGSYLPLNHFVTLHLNLAGQKRADHLHGGMGFLTQHVALSNAFEVALRVVNPGVSLPFWDFTEDADVVASTTDEVRTLWQLDVWRPSWFGNASGSVYHTVEEGRWAFQRVSQASENPVHNPYGYMRSPWNMNKSPFLTRVHLQGHASQGQAPYGVWPECRDHHAVLEDSEYETWSEYAINIENAPHGGLHDMIGGYFNTGDLVASVGSVVEGDLGAVAIGELATNLYQLPKNMYRYWNLSGTTGGADFEFPAFCSEDTPQNDCHMICPEFLGKEVIESFAHLFRYTFPWLLQLTDEQLTGVLKIVCTTPWSMGEHIESASPADVSFWPIHPTLDRLTQYRRLVKPFTDAEWDGGVYCGGFSGADQKGDCDGHHPWDLTNSDVNYLDDQGTFQYKRLSNGELFIASDPHDYRLDYVYEDFNWAHCDTSGFYFPKIEW